MVDNDIMTPNGANETNSAEEPKRKRTRILKKDTTDKVYTVNGTDGENLDTKAARKSASKKTAVFNTPAPEPEAPVNPFPKHRGRKSKAELEYIAKMKEQENALFTENVAEKAEPETTEPVANDTEFAPIPEATEQPDIQEAQVPEVEYEAEGEEKSEEDKDLISMLQEKMKQTTMQETSSEDTPAESIWEGDPDDGTDFIIVEDIPVEDSAATYNYDIFDNPTTNINTEDTFAEKDGKDELYDFGNIITSVGVLEAMPDGYGFLRSSDYNYLSSPDDVYVPANTLRRYGLKTGDVVECSVVPPRNNDKYFVINEILHINGRKPDEIRDRVAFEHLTPLFPDEKFNLCGNPHTTKLSTRVVDLFSPIGKGQRALIVAQPKTGKTILMKEIANAIASSHPEAYLMMLLIDERPEEVTDMARTVNAEVIASTFDEPAERHVKIAGLVLEKAKRMVECGHDVVIFLDSITRLARAYNTVAPASGKVLTGGVDANALQKPKRFFGAARNIENGGSLTIIATALIDTGSKMDEVIFEEFKGTGNMELQLERAIANKRIFPAVNLIASSTRRDDLLQDDNTIKRMWVLRKFIADMNPVEAMTEMKGRIESTKDNEEFLVTMNS